MDTVITFEYRGSRFTANAYFSFEQEPYFIFFVLHDSYLTSLFGTDLTIKTDFEKVLPSKNHYTELSDLLCILFDAVRSTPEFVSKRK